MKLRIKIFFDDKTEKELNLECTLQTLELLLNAKNQQFLYLQGFFFNKNKIKEIFVE